MRSGNRPVLAAVGVLVATLGCGTAQSAPSASDTRPRQPRERGYVEDRERRTAVVIPVTTRRGARNQEE